MRACACMCMHVRVVLFSHVHTMTDHIQHLQAMVEWND